MTEVAQVISFETRIPKVLEKRIDFMRRKLEADKFSFESIKSQEVYKEMANLYYLVLNFKGNYGSLPEVKNLFLLLTTLYDLTPQIFQNNQAVLKNTKFPIIAEMVPEDSIKPDTLNFMDFKAKREFKELEARIQVLKERVGPIQKFLISHEENYNAFLKLIKDFLVKYPTVEACEKYKKVAADCSITDAEKDKVQHFFSSSLALSEDSTKLDSQQG